MIQLQNNPNTQQRHSETSQNKDTFVYKFKQQIIEAWRPVPSTNSSIILYLILTIFFITIGIIILVYTTSQKKIEVRYDNQCGKKNPCTLTINITTQMTGPVYLYYGLKNFYQNHHKFMSSKSETQLTAKKQYGSINQAKINCGSKITNGDMGWTIAADKTTTLNSDQIAFPCGMIAYSRFNDSFSINAVTISNSGIAWPQDAKQYQNWDLSKQGIDLKDEHWLVWLRPAVRNDFYKLWGIINQDLPASGYNLTITNNYDVSAFGEKWILISKANAFGDNNILLGVAYLVGGGISLILLLGFTISKLKEKNQKKTR